MLCEAESGARQGKHQYLSGILHNAAKILEANADHPTDPVQTLQALGLTPSKRILPALCIWPYRLSGGLATEGAT